MKAELTSDKTRKNLRIKAEKREKGNRNKGKATRKEKKGKNYC